MLNIRSEKGSQGRAQHAAKRVTILNGPPSGDSLDFLVMQNRPHPVTDDL